MKFTHTSGTFVEIGSANIYYEELGNPLKQPLIFLHGGFGNIEDFNGIISLLENEYRIIGIDSRGQGKSTLGSEGMSYERLEQDVSSIIRKLALKSPLLIGFSDGGVVALRLACKGSVDIRKLILIGTSWHTKSLESSKVFLSAVTADTWKAKFPETFEKYQSLNPEPDFEKLTTSMVSMWLDEGPTAHPDDDVVKISCPTLIVRGDKDHLTSRESTFELSEKIAASDLANIPFCGHEVYAEQPGLLMKMINEFLKKD